MSGASTDRPRVPRIVLPITSRGLEVTDRLCWVVLGIAMAAATVLILYLNRGTTFNTDQMAVFLTGPTFELRDAFEPVNGHLGAVTALVYQGTLEAFGADYLPFRILHIVVLLVTTGLFFALAKRLVGPVVALPLALVTLFLGSDWGHVSTPVGFTVVLSVGAGIGALLALERDNARGNVIACALLILSAATFSTGLALLVGAAILIALRGDRWQRAWIVLVPVALYAAWWLWALSEANSADQNTTVANLLLIPGYAFESLAAVTAAVMGLGYGFAGTSPPEVDIGWGYALAPVAVIALVVRIRRGSVPLLLWVGLGIVLAYWVLGALAYSSVRPPGLNRYIYLGAVGVLLVAAAGVSTTRFSKVGVAAVYVLAAVSVATNLAFTRDATRYVRDGYSRPARAQLAMVELARDRVDPDFNPVVSVQGAAPVSAPAGAYLGAVDRYGSPAFTVAELKAQPEGAREVADRVLAAALDLKLRPTSAPTPDARCMSIDEGEIELPPGVFAITADGAGDATVELGRFATAPAAGLAKLGPGDSAFLEIPPDAERAPWRASFSGAGSVEVCPIR